MKKTLSVLLIAILTVALCVSLTACKDYEGTYKLESVSMYLNGVKLEIEIGKEINVMGTKMTFDSDACTLTLYKDNSFKMAIDLLGQKKSQNGTWEAKDGKIVLSVDNETVDVTVDGDKLTFEQDGIKLSLVKMADDKTKNK